MPRMEVPAFAAELHGSFADLAAQLQTCVQHLREGESWHMAAALCRFASVDRKKKLLIHQLVLHALQMKTMRTSRRQDLRQAC